MSSTENKINHRASADWRIMNAVDNQYGLVIVGANLITAVKTTLPALFRLYCSNKGLRGNFRVVCLCCPLQEDLPADASTETEKDPTMDYLSKNLGPGDRDGFLSKCCIVLGDFRDSLVTKAVAAELEGFSKIIVYFAARLILQPGEEIVLANTLGQLCDTDGGFLRCIIERPIGMNVSSSKALMESLCSSFHGEANIFRLDHFLGKNMVQNILALRFSNRIFEPSWNNNHIQAVVISCYESKGCSGEYIKYFDKYNIIREILIDHLFHIMALVAMETPVSLENVNDEVAKLLRCIRPLDMDNVVLGQYEGYQTELGSSNSGESTTPTFVTCVFYVDNPRWFGVPFIFKAGKGMYESRTDVRIQFKNPHNTLFPSHNRPNELVIRIQPDTSMYLKMMQHNPGGRAFDVHVTKLNMDSDPAYVLGGNNGTMNSILNAYIPNAHERLIYDVMNNDRTYFAMSDELEALYSVIDPLLKRIDHCDSHPLPLYKYAMTSRGPLEAYALTEIVGFDYYKLPSELVGKTPFTSELQRLSSEFTLANSQLEEIVSHFLHEFDLGLRGDPDARLKMLPSYVTSLPRGTDSGAYYALDLGGTNFRVLRFCLDGKGDVKITDERKFSIPNEVMVGEGERLFDFIAECVGTIDIDEERNYGFTFSFPVNQTSLNRGILMNWNKGFQCDGVVGKDVVSMLEDAFKRRNFEGKVVALVNDTVGTLIASAYVDPRTMVGVILGTGTNAAYRELVENIPKLPQSLKEAGGEMIINMEWGNFGSMKRGYLPFTDIDDALDATTCNPSLQRFEKMISGMYLGEITRRALVRLHEAGEIYTNTNVANFLFTPYGLPTRFLSDVEYDMTDELDIVRLAEEKFGLIGSTVLDRMKLKEVCGMVVARAARLTACGLAATIRQIGRNRKVECTVGIDGSVYEHHPSFRLRLKKALRELGANCHILTAKDGSGEGAALIACASCN